MPGWPAPGFHWSGCRGRLAAAAAVATGSGVVPAGRAVAAAAAVARPLVASAGPAAAARCWPGRSPTESARRNTEDGPQRQVL